MSLVSHSANVEQTLSGKRVLIIVENLPVPFDRRVWQQATSLRAAGATVSVICPTGKGFEPREEEINGIAIFRYALPSELESVRGYLREYIVALWWSFFLTCRVFSRRGFDLIHICNPPDFLFLVAAPFKLLGKKIIFDHHDLNPELYEAKFKRRDYLWRILLWLERLTFASADVSIATNESYKAVAIERGRMDKGRVFVVRSGPDLNRIRAVAPDWALKEGNRFLVGYLGVIGEQEGVDLLLQAAAHLCEQQRRDDIMFLIIGDGPSLPKLKAMALNLGLDHCVRFLGRVSDECLLTVLSTADVCVNSDRWSVMNDKSTMNKILEYMALGKPIVQFDLTEGRVSAGAASLYARRDDPIDMANKISDLLASPDKREQMASIGRARIQANLSWQHQIPHLIAAYRKAFGMSEAEAS